MDKETLIKLWEHFGKIKEGINASKSEVYVVLVIRNYSDDDWYHYLFIRDKKSDVHFTVCIKGFNGLYFDARIETFEDILREIKVKVEQNG